MRNLRSVTMIIFFVQCCIVVGSPMFLGKVSTLHFFILQCKTVKKKNALDIMHTLGAELFWCLASHPTHSVGHLPGDYNFTRREELSWWGMGAADRGQEFLDHWAQEGPMSEGVDDVIFGSPKTIYNRIVFIRKIWGFTVIWTDAISVGSVTRSKTATVFVVIDWHFVTGGGTDSEPSTDNTAFEST